MFYIEILIILIILAYAWGGYRLGFVSQFLDLIGLVIAFILALKYYNALGSIYAKIGINENLINILGFFTLLILAQIILYLLFRIIIKATPEYAKCSSINKTIGILPGMAKGFLIIAIILMITMVLPISPTLKENITNKPISGYILRTTSDLEDRMKTIFETADTKSGANTITGNQETIQLEFKTDEVTVDEKSENEMLTLVNTERVNAGLKPLKIDNTIRLVARNYSTVMLAGGYFSHTDANGGNPSDRLTAGKVTYKMAGENIALAPSVQLAQTGFMNSLKHRENILEPGFGRIGIGVIDAGKYGKMFTQNFAD